MHCQGTRGSRRRALGHVHTDALIWYEAKSQYPTECSSGQSKNTLPSKHLRCGSFESHPWQHNNKGCWHPACSHRRFTFLLQKNPKTFLSLISWWSHELHYSVLFFPETGYEILSWNRIQLISQGRHAPHTTSFFKGLRERRNKAQKKKKDKQTK